LTSWLKTLEAELVEVDLGKAALEALSEVGLGEEIVGDVGSETKKLYLLAKLFSKTAAEIKVKLDYAETPTERQEHARKYAELHEKTEVLANLFWISVKDELNLWDKGSIGIRKGWKVVVFNTPSSFLDILKGNL